MNRAMLIALVVGALLLPGRPVYAALYLVGGVWLLARWSLRQAASRLQITRTLSDSRVFYGESVTVTLRLRNESPFPLPWLQVLERRPQPLAVGTFDAVTSLGPGEEATFRYSLDGLRRGRHTIGPLLLTAGDPFGFGHAERALEGLDRLTVYPRIFPLPELGLPARLPMGDLAVRRRLFEDPAWLAGTRPYLPSDSMRRIHWPATARTGELVTRQFRHAMLLPAAVCLNLRRQDYPGAAIWRSELAVSTAASLAQHLVREKQQVALIAAADDADGGDGRAVTPLRHGVQGLTDLLELLARLGPTRDEKPFATLLTEEARRLPLGTLLAAVTPVETDAIAASCARLTRSGYGVLLFVLDGEPGLRAGGYRVWHLSDVRGGEVAAG